MNRMGKNTQTLDYVAAPGDKAVMYQTDITNLDWPKWRLRFLLNKTRNEDEQQCLKVVREVTFLPMESVGEYGGIDVSEIREKGDVEKGYTLFFEGDVLIAKITPCFENGKGALAKGLLNGIGFGTTELYVLDPSSALDENFLFYLSISEGFRAFGEASMKGAAGQKRVPDEFIQNFVVALPPLDNQHRIANYLDRETTRIDALVAEKERMLALLEEKRTALISRAVTHGLDPDVPLKPSGLDWLGEIPEHWHLRRCATLFKEKDERGQPELPLLNVSLNTGVTLREFSDDRIESVAADFNTYKVAPKNSLIFNKMRFWQGAAGIAPTDGLTSPDYTVAEIDEELLPEYVEFLVRTPQFNGEVRRYSYGMVDDRLRLYWDGFKNIFVPVPPVEEQRQIITHIENEISAIDEIVSVMRRSIDLLKERRSALITAAVTGQIDPKAMGHESPELEPCLKP